jgi:hypothetical protein
MRRTPSCTIGLAVLAIVATAGCTSVGETGDVRPRGAAPTDPDRGDEAPPEGEVSFEMLQETPCVRTVKFDSATSTLTVTRGDDTETFALDAGDRQVAMTALLDPAFLDQIQGSCEDADTGEQMILLTPSLSVSIATQGCATGMIAEVRSQFDGMADAYAPSMACEALPQG